MILYLYEFLKFFSNRLICDLLALEFVELLQILELVLKVMIKLSNLLFPLHIFLFQKLD